MAHMIEKNDSMFSVREKPWHYAETKDRCKIIKTAVTSKEAITLAGLDWDVKQSDVYMEGGILVPNSKINYRVTKSGATIPLGVVSDKYKIVQNVDAFSFTDELIGEKNGIYYETAGSLNNGKRIWLLAKMPDTEIAGDKVEPYMCFTNAHDGKGAVQVAMTAIRVVCNNTLSLALGTAKRSWSTKHIGDIAYKMEEARMCLGMANNYMEKLSTQANILANTKISMDEIGEILDMLYPVKETDSDKKKNNVQAMKNDFYRCYIAPDISQFLGTAWGAVNAMSDLVTHGQPLRKTENFEENRWGKIIGGHILMDKFYEVMCANVGIEA